MIMPDAKKRLLDEFSSIFFNANITKRLEKTCNREELYTIIMYHIVTLKYQYYLTSKRLYETKEAEIAFKYQFTR